MSYSYTYDSPVEYSIKFDLRVKRCTECGAIWAIESRKVDRAQCPSCTHSTIEDLRRVRDQAFTQISHMKGALTRAKKKGTS